MKKVLVLVLLALIMAFVFGCGQTKEPEQQQAAPTTVTGEEQKPGDNEKQAGEQEKQPLETVEAEGAIYNPLTGKKVFKVIPLTAVMVNNHPKARPQTGLAQADVVYEMEMEGLVTRFMAIFYGDPPETVGSVRSARTYALELAKEWDSYYIHVGGSDDAFDKIARWKVRDIDDTRGHAGFFLDKSKDRPHNTFVSLQKALQGKPDAGKFKEWEFVDPPEGEPDYEEIVITYDPNYNQPKYIYSAQAKGYLRYINDQPHTDQASGEQIKVTNVILQYARHRYLGDELKHIDIELVGKGKAEYFLAGKYLRGTWEKKNRDAPTIFCDQEGNQIKLAKGNTWIQILRSEDQVAKK